MSGSIFRWLAGALPLFALAAGFLYVVAGLGTPPLLTINQPRRTIGQTGMLDVTAEAPNVKFTALAVVLEQEAKTIPLFALTDTRQATISPAGANRLRVTGSFDLQSVPGLKSGPARIVVSATRPSFLNLRQLTTTVSKDVTVRLDPPRIAVVSTKHYVTLGGSEMVVYTARPHDVISGVRVGNAEFRGFPAASAGMTGAAPDLFVAFFALLYDQDLRRPIVAFARDEAGSEAQTTFVDNVLPKAFTKSRIELDDEFIDRVVPDIIEHSPELGMSVPTRSTPEMLTAFVKVNSELRRFNADQIAAFAAKTAPNKLWQGPFVQLANSQVEASFADRRTYFYKGKEVDQQTHLGFDLAVTSRVPVVAANTGTVLNASWLGIYGNCVILDHGMGVQSLYGHLSSFDVKVGDTVTRGQTLGRSGMTGLAGGDHLHFTMLVGGHMVNPVEWWDAHWIADRIQRKLDESVSQ
jgi:murein DD-endopeptidase MepM/ murein hydrolase activator NlpD